MIFLTSTYHKFFVLQNSQQSIHCQLYFKTVFLTCSWCIPMDELPWMSALPSLLISPVTVSHSSMRSWSKSGLLSQHNKMLPQKTMACVQKVVFSINCSVGKAFVIWNCIWKIHIQQNQWSTCPSWIALKWLVVHKTTQAPQISIKRSASHHWPKSSQDNLEDKPELTFGYWYVMKLPRTHFFTSEIIVD